MATRLELDASDLPEDELAQWAVDLAQVMWLGFKAFQGFLRLSRSFLSRSSLFTCLSGLVFGLLSSISQRRRPQRPFRLDATAKNQFGAMGAKVSTQTRSGRALFEELRRRDLPVMPAVPVDDEKKGGLLSHGL